MEIGTATFTMYAPNTAPRRYTLVCGVRCAHRTLDRLQQTLQPGDTVTMQWWDADGNPAAGGCVQHIHANIVLRAETVSILQHLYKPRPSRHKPLAMRTEL